MSLASLKSYLLGRTTFLGLRPASTAADSDAADPALSGAHGGLVVEGVSGGEPIPVSGTVTATVDVSTLATAAKQDTLAALVATSALQTAGNASLTSIDGKITACNTGAVTISSCALPTGASTAALQGTVRHTTTPSKADAATGAPEVDDRGNLHATLTIASSEILALQGPETDALTAAEIATISISCDAVEANAASIYVYAQLREAPRLVSITPADWTAGTGWAFAGTVATHTPGGGSAGDLEITDECFHLGVPYALYFATTMTAGTLTDKLGTAGATARAATGSFIQILVPTVEGKVIFSADDDSDASVDITGVWVLPFHELPNAGIEKPLACSMIGCIATKAAPATKVISPATTALRALSYRRQGAVQS
ncbi:MAG: hypothetical protein M0R22_11755 [Dehalococcoidia bacterium]|nr:hypothetical protein [Dehalococcoidia bacterium]